MGDQAAGCEHSATGPWIEPVSTVTSLAYLVVGLAVLLAYRRAGRDRVVFGVVVALVGAGSVIQHGPAPSWADLAHDLPLTGLLTLAAVDAVAGLAGRRMRQWWWLAPTVAMVPLILVEPVAADVVQAAVAAVAVLATLLRARAVPEHRRRLLTALALLAVGSAIGTLARTGGPLCFPGSPVQGHGAWHLLSAAAMWVLAPVVGGSAGSAPSRWRTR